MTARSTDTHKNRVGRVLIVGGAVGMAGAVVLGARSAFAAGAGLVRVCSVRENRDVLQAAVPEAIFVACDDQDAVAAAVASSDALGVGPGLGLDAGARATLRMLTDGPGPPLVLDADALTLAAEGVVDLTAIAARRRLVITPHPGEMTRLERGGGPKPPEVVGADDDGPRVVGSETAAHRADSDVRAHRADSDVRAHRADSVVRARRAAERFGCAVLLKGAPSVVADGTGPVVMDTQGTSDLAVAGMGDTLTGVCSALVARGGDAATAASVALYLSGRAAVLAGRGAGLVPSDVIRWLPDAMREVAAPETDLGLPFVGFDAAPAR